MEEDKQVHEARKDIYLKANTHQRRTCEGHIYIVVNRKEDGKFDSLLITPPSKTNECGYSYASAIQDLATFALRRAEGERDIKLIIKALAGHYCNAMPPNKDKCKSCVDAVANVIKQEFLDGVS